MNKYSFVYPRGQFSHRQGRAEVKNRRCLNPACPSYGTVGSRTIIHNGFYRTRSGKRRRYRCGECGKTFSSDERHALLPSPTSKSYFRWGHRSQSRGCQHFLDFPDRRACLEHRRPLAREGSPSVSSIQPHKDRWLRCRRASSRRDSHVRGQQEDAELGLRYDRGLVSALAIDGDGKAKLPEHSRSVSRPFEADEFRASSLDRYGWIRILPEGHPSLLSGQRVSTAKSSKRAGTIVSSRSNGERCTEPRGDSKTRLITPRTPQH